MHLFKEGENWKVEPGPLGVEALVVDNIKELYFHQRNLQKETDDTVIRQPPDIWTQLCC